MDIHIFDQVFGNRYIVDKIKSYLPDYIKYSESLLLNFHIPGSSLKHLSYSDFYVYTALHFGYDNAFDYEFNNHENNEKVSYKLIDAIAEENNYSIIEKIYQKYICPTQKCMFYQEILCASYRSLISAVKHNNLKMVKILHEKLNITPCTIIINNKFNCKCNNVLSDFDRIDSNRDIDIDNEIIDIESLIKNNYYKIVELAIRNYNKDILQYICENMLTNSMFDNSTIYSLIVIAIECGSLDCCLYMLNNSIFFDTLTNHYKNRIKRIVTNTCVNFAKELFQDYNNYNNLNNHYSFLIRELNNFQLIVPEENKGAINYIIQSTLNMVRNNIICLDIKFFTIKYNLIKLLKQINRNKRVYNYRYTNTFIKNTQEYILTNIMSKVSYSRAKQEICNNLQQLIPKFIEINKKICSN